MPCGAAAARSRRCRPSALGGADHARRVTEAAASKARIEIIPLIDIIFFLLATFIMVSLSMTKNQGVQVALPTASSAASLGDQQEMEKAVTLSVNEKGDVFYNKEKITLAQLPHEAADAQVDGEGPEGRSSTATPAPTSSTSSACSTRCARSASRKVGINTDKK